MKSGLLYESKIEIQLRFMVEQEHEKNSCILSNRSWLINGSIHNLKKENLKIIKKKLNAHTNFLSICIEKVNFIKSLIL